MLLVAALTFSATACNKAEDKKEDEKAAGGAVEAPKKVAVAEVGQAAAPAAELTSPGKVSIDQAIAVMGSGAQNRIVMRLAPLAKSGLVEMGMGVMPPEAKAEYDKFVAESGFDPMKQFSGMLVFADGDISSFKQAKPTMVFGINGAVTEQLIEYLDKKDKDDDDDDDDKGEMRMALLAELSPEVMAKFVALLEKQDEGEEVKAEKKEMDGAIAMAKVEKGMAKFVYLWEGGVIFGAAADTGVAPLEAVDAPLKALLGELGVAAKADPSTSDIALEARIVADGKNIKTTLTLDDKVTLDVSATLGDEELKQAQGFLSQFPEMKKNPDALLAKAPPFLHDLGKLMLAGTDINVDGSEVLGRIQVDLSALKAALGPALENLK